MTIFPPKWQVLDICKPPINHKGLNWDSNGWLCNILMPIALTSDIYIFIWAITNLFINLLIHSSKSIITRHSENDNTPQPLDQWMNSPFIGHIDPYLADLFAMHRGPRSIPLCFQHHNQLTSLSFQVSWPSDSWVTAVSIFYLENPTSWSKSRSWVRLKFEVTMWV